MTKVLLISHEPQAAPGRIGRLLRERGVDVDLHVVLADSEDPNTNFPDPTHYDAVIAFGSFQNAYDAQARVWVDPEVDYIRTLVQQDTPYLGVCFGGQLLAKALGGEVVKAEDGADEIGLLSFPSDAPVPSGPWFTWHEDRIELPEHVSVLMRNENAVQLFQSGRAVGTQFHPEANVELVRMWTQVGADHLPAQVSASELLEDLHTNDAMLDSNCAELVDWFWRTAVDGK